MNKFLKKFAIFGVLVAQALTLLSNVNAQTRSPSSQPLARDYFPHKWNEHTSLQGKFHIRFPGTPEEFISSTDGNVLEYTGLLKFWISYTDDTDPIPAIDLLQARKSSNLAIAQAAKERVVKENPILVGGHPGYFLHVDNAEGFIRVQEFLVGKRLYTIVVEGRKARPEEPEGKNDFEGLAMGFINSFRLLRR